MTRLKHLSGQHPQSSHAGGRGSSKISSEQVDNILNELGSNNTLQQAFEKVGIVSPDKFASDVKGKSEAAKALGEKYGTKVNNDNLHTELKPGDKVLVVSGGGYGSNFGTVKSIKREIVPTEDRRSDGPWSIQYELEPASKNGGSVIATTYPRANWHSSKDSFYKMDVE